MLQEFLASAALRYNQATIKAYGTDIRQFALYCENQQIPIAQITQAQAIAYREHIKSSNVAVATQSRKLSALWSFYAWAVRQNRMTANPFEGVQVRRNKAQVRRRRTSVGEDFDRLLNVIGITDRSEARDRVIFRTMYDTKIRLRDILTLNVSDFDYRSGKIKVNNIEHPLSKHTADELRAYLTARVNLQAASPLFVNRGGDRISDRSIRRRLASHCVRAGISGISPYAFSGTQRSAYAS